MAVMVTLVQGVLLRPLPVREPDRVVVAWKELWASGFTNYPFGDTEIEEVGTASRLFEQVAGVTRNGVARWVVTGDGEARSVRGAFVTGGFDVLDVDAFLGRTLTRDDDREGAPGVLTISHGYWQRRCGGAPDVVGRRLIVRERPYLIVGVLPPGFGYPVGTEVWRTTRRLPGVVSSDATGRPHRSRAAPALGVHGAVLARPTPCVGHNGAMTSPWILIRRLLAKPGFAAVSVVTLAVGIGATLAIFTVVNAVLLRPLPVPDSDRLVTLEHAAPGLTQLDRLPMSDALYFLYRDQSRTLDGVALYEDTVVSFTGPDDPVRVPAANVTASFFEVIRTPPLLGRTFDEADEGTDAPPRAVLTHGLWQSRYGGDPDVVGRLVEIDGAGVEIVGVMPAGFAFPNPDTRIWQPLRPRRTPANLGSFSAQGLGRIAAGATLAQVQAELAGMATNLEALFPDEAAAPVLANAGFTPNIQLARERIVGDIRATLWILQGAVGVLLLIACANVANLFLARAEARHRELAIRMSLGESRMQVAGSAMAESLVLALSGGLVAAPLAFAAVRLLVRFGPQELPRLQEIAPDGTVLAFGVVMSLAAGLVFGTLPALKAATIPASAGLNEGARGASATRERHLARRGLVVVQIALALTLLVGSGLAARSYQRLATVDPGFDPTGVITLSLSLPGRRYESAGSRLQFHRQLLERLSGLPGATAAAAVSHLPLGGSLSGSGTSIEGRPLEDRELPPVFMMKRVSPDYFDAMGIELREGRDFERLDAESGASVVIVSEGLARAHWPGESALGKGIRPGGAPGESEDWFRVIGVVEDVHQQSLHDPPPELAYYPLAVPAGAGTMEVPLGMSYVVRSDGAQPAGAARAAVRALDPSLPVSDLDTMDTLVARARAERAFVMVLLLIASGFAVLLGAVGLYGVIAYVVAQRRREIAIRMAIGAARGDIRRLVLTEAGWLALAGTGLGLGGAVVLTRRLQALLFETSPLDPTVLAGVSMLLAGICLVASWLPARRATRVEPVSALRAE